MALIRTQLGMRPTVMQAVTGAGAHLPLTTQHALRSGRRDHIHIGNMAMVSAAYPKST